jgi:hypothetical protein
VYFEHRTSGTHAVLLLSSLGMDVKLRNNESATAATTLEYNVIACSTFTFWRAARPTRLRLRGSMHRFLGCPLRCRTGRLACTSADMDTKVSASRLGLRGC